MKIFLSLLLIACVGLGGLSFFFFQENAKLNTQLDEAKDLVKNIESEYTRFQTEQKQIIAEANESKEKVTACLTLNANLKQEKEELTKNLESAKAQLEEKEKNIASLNEKVKGLEARANRGKSSQLIASEKVEQLRNRIAELESTLAKEKGAYYYNLAVAYSHAKFYDKAIEAYQQSITYSPNNADAYYNLGLLYENVLSDSRKAIKNYKKYLELNPKAQDKSEVEERIEQLETW